MPTNNNVNVEVASYTNNGIFEKKQFEKMGDLLREYGIDFSEAVIDVTGEDGEDRRVTAAMNLQEGDTIVIMKAKNKSGNR